VVGGVVEEVARRKGGGVENEMSRSRKRREMVESICCAGGTKVNVYGM
jgi:hypothetical protein